MALRGRRLLVFLSGDARPPARLSDFKPRDLMDHSLLQEKERIPARFGSELLRLHDRAGWLSERPMIVIGRAARCALVWRGELRSPAGLKKEQTVFRMSWSVSRLSFGMGHGVSMNSDARV